MSLDNFTPFGNRFVDVGAGGPNPFTFSVATNATWLTPSVTKGSISTQNPEERVFFNVDWSKVTGVQFAQIAITAVAKGQPNLVQTIGFIANKTTVPSDFKGM